MPFIVDLSVNILASIIYDSSKGLFNEFNKYLNSSIIDTSNYIKQKYQIEFNTKKFREILKGEISSKEIEKFSTKEGLIDFELLYKELAIFGDIYLGEDQEYLVFNLSKEIIDYFLKRFEHYLLSDSKYSSKLLIKYLNFYSAKSQNKHDEIIEELNKINSKFDEKLLKFFESLFIFPLSEHLGFEEKLKSVAKERAISIEELKTEIDAWLENVEGAYAKGIKYFYENKGKKAEQYLLESASFMEHKIFEHYMLLAQNYLINLRDIQNSLEYYNKAFHMKDNDYECLHNLGFVNLFMGNINASIIFSDKALIIKPNDVYTLNNIASAYIDIGEYALAKKYLDRALSIDATCAVTYINLAGYYEENNDDEKAIESYKTAITLNSEDPAFHNNLGKIYGDLGKYDLAIKSFNKAIELNKNYVSAIVNLGITYNLCRNENKAELCFRESLKIKSEDDMTLNTEKSPSRHHEAYFQLGLILQKRNQLNEAMIYYKKALETNKRHTSSILNIGTCHRYLLEYPEAITWFNIYIKEEPQNKFGYFNLACVYSLQKEFENSYLHLKKAIELDPTIKSVSQNYPDLVELINNPIYKSKILLL